MFISKVRCAHIVCYGIMRRMKCTESKLASKKLAKTVTVDGKRLEIGYLEKR